MYRWYDKKNFSKKIDNLHIRVKTLKAIRKFFDKKKFMEVDTNILQISPGMEPHLHAFETKLDDSLKDKKGNKLYLHTSPEFAMKKLLSAGLKNIYQITKAFRNENSSHIHQPEFFMLEWYRVEKDYKDLMKDCKKLLRFIVRKTRRKVFKFNGIKSNPFKKWQYISIAEAFEKYAKIDVLATIDNPNKPSAKLIKEAAKKIKISVSKNDTWQDVYYKIFLEKIEPKLGVGVPTILYDYPISEAALSKPSDQNPHIAERFELYICGMEVANAFSELTDHKEQLSRFKDDMEVKKKLYGYDYPIDMALIDALKTMPNSAGIALGVDRLIMLLCNEKDIKNVLFTYID